MPAVLSQWRSRLPLAALMAVLAGCNQASLRGTVLDVTGDALPGVAIHVEGFEFEALTNALGEYRIRCAPGKARFTFSKTGYAPRRLEKEMPDALAVVAPPIRLWPLPPSAGVYLYDGHRYRATTWVEPKRFFMAEGSMAYGTQRSPEGGTPRKELLIVCYKTPRYDARISRLHEALAKRGAAESHVFPIWTEGGTVRADLVPIDSAEGMLLELQLDQSLAPGTYAVHWGALDGYKTLEKRIFMFEITESIDESGGPGASEVAGSEAEGRDAPREGDGGAGRPGSPEIRRNE